MSNFVKLNDNNIKQTNAYRDIYVHINTFSEFFTDRQRQKYTNVQPKHKSYVVMFTGSTRTEGPKCIDLYALVVN